MDVPNRWQQRLYYFSLVAVLFTTLFSWFNLNSVCIMLLVVSRLLYKPLSSIKAAFRNRVFLAFFVFYVIEALGFLHTHNLEDQAKAMSKEATMVAIAFVGCAGEFAGERIYRRLLTAYYYLLLAASVYCLFIAVRNYLVTRDSSVFFYHSLTRPISQNAVFFSVYIVFGLLFLLAPYGEPLTGPLPRWTGKAIRYSLVGFFLGMIVLLNSKLMLVIALLILVTAFLLRRTYRQNKLTFLIAGSALLLGIGVLALTANPISARYRDMAGDLALIRQPEFNPGIYFNPIQLRLLEWRFATGILHEHHAWVFGVSPGDSQDLLDQQYVKTHMYIGNPAEGPHRHIRGFIGYNFHNQYLETLVRSGLLGLAALLAIFVLLFAAAGRQGTKEAWMAVLLIAIFFIPEAPLTLQHGVFLFCFFPLLALAAPKKA
jgi:O-antigen ligase